MPAVHSTVARALAVLAAALALRAVYILWIGRTACLDINLDPISDMEAFHRWALTIVRGDWLGRGDFHPFHPWQTAVAPPERWGFWYGHVFHQEPLYPYLIALVYLLAPPAPLSVIVMQLALGAAGCAFTYLAARRLVPEGAALCAGILSAFYGPYLYYESLLLRDSFLIPLHAALLWVLLEGRARAGTRTAWRWWGGGGLLAGLACITKSTILPFFALLLGWVLWERRGLPAPRRAAPALTMLAGFAVAVSPVLARNLIVGAPLMRITTRGPIEFVNGNNPWHVGTGWFDGGDRRVSAYAREILERSGGRLLPTAAAVLRSWSSDPAGLVRLQLVKTGYFFAPFEMPNNASYSYFRLNCPLLRYGALSFFWVSPLALLGLIASWRRRAELAPIYLFLGPGILLTIAFYVIARFRAPFMPAILVLAGLGLWTLRELIRLRAWRGLAAASLLLAAALAVNAASDYRDRDLLRPQDYLVSIRGYQARGMQERALAEAESARKQFPSFPEFHKAAALIYLSQGKPREAMEALRAVLERNPSDAEARRELLRLAPGAP